MIMNTTGHNKIIKLSVVMERTGLSRSSIYLKMKKNEFPKAILLGARAVGWLESEVEEWVQERVNAARSGNQFRSLNAAHLCLNQGA